MRFKIMPSFNLWIVRDTLGTYPDSKPLLRDQAVSELSIMCATARRDADELLMSVGCPTTSAMKQQIIDTRRWGEERLNWRERQLEAVVTALEKFDELPLWERVMWLLRGAKLAGVARARVEDVSCPPSWHWAGERDAVRAPQ